eukprot:gnl/MRDRNA2_/MRDRNA2_106732_c0_seq1.p1 gnl/MRDRNA2_/MRDRNA2_106732_c0~~gnl/MRDRNA2_/MRDRNA2_106732_c0_seq1.p1  ORF type:complete len:287 (-),score=36.65 gnl/MRDRNA2_/MRDRNA2_106732_c0_seq1:178-1038(-)
MKGLLVGISTLETSETAFLATVALLCLTLCPRLKGASVALGCFMIDQALQWRRLDGECMTQPIYLWLLGAYAFAVVCYLSCATVVKQCKKAQGDGGCIAQESQRPVFSRSMLALSTMVLPTCLLAWTGLGMIWLADVLGSDTQCADNNGHESITFAVACILLLGLQALVCAVVAYHASVVAESVVRGSAAVLAIADADFVERWGAPKPVLQEDLSRGLSPAQIDALPCGEGLADGESCVICLCPVTLDERVRQMPSCSHRFHKCCVDQWLLRCAACPTCKAEVVVE